MKRACLVVLAVVLALVMGVLVASCGKGDDGAVTSGPQVTGGTTTTAPPTTSIKIGVALSLTGEDAAACVQIKEGLETEVEYINANGGINGRRVEIAFQDDQSTLDTAKAAVSALIDAGVDVIIGPFAQWSTHPARQMTEEAGIFHIAFGPPTLVELAEDQSGYTYSFVAAPGADAEAEAWLAEMLADGRTNVLGIGDQTYIHQEGLMLLTQLLAENGITYTKLNVSWGAAETDVTPIANVIATKVAELHPDALIIATQWWQVNDLIKTLRSMGVSAPVYGSVAGAHPLVMLAVVGNNPANVAGDYAMGPPMVNPGSVPEPYPARQDLLDFVARWQAKYPQEPAASYLLGFAYDAIHLAEQAIMSATEATPEAWALAMESVDWWGAQGHYVYSDFDHIGIHGGFMQWQYTNGEGFKFVRVLN